MKKQLRLVKGTQVAIDEWSKQTYPLPEIPNSLYSRHFRRRAKYKYMDGTVIIDLCNGWYVHSFRNGVRMLSVLPF